MSVLDLSGADTSGFDPIPSGTYNVRVERAEWGEVSEQSELLAGAPRLNIGFVVTDGDYEGRWVWNGFIVPPESYDETKAARMKGFLVNFLDAAQVIDKSDEKSLKKLNMDVGDLIGRELSVRVARKPRSRGSSEMVNAINGYHKLGELAEAGTSGLL
jgi:hypothetical protein